MAQQPAKISLPCLENAADVVADVNGSGTSQLDVSLSGLPRQPSASPAPPITSTSGASRSIQEPGGAAPAPPSSPPPSAPLPPGKDTRYPFPLSTLESALQTPALDHQVGAHVAHLVAHREGPASEVLAELLEVPQELMARLIWFGAVYYCPVAPLPPGTGPPRGGGGGGGNRSRGPGVSASASPPSPSSTSASGPQLTLEQIASIQAVRQAALAKWGRHSKHQTPRRLSSDQLVSEGGYLRAHLHPKRFPRAHSLPPDGEEWARRVLAVAPDHVVVNKPAGLQVPPTVDNVRESLLACVEQALSLPPNSLHPAHRLDAGTEGVVVLARDAAFASHFRELMAHKKQHSVRKQYRCLVPLPASDTSETTASGSSDRVFSSCDPPPNDPAAAAAAAAAPTSHPPLGPRVHWVLEDQREAGVVAHTVVVGGPDTPGAARCELRVEKVERVRLGPRAVGLWGVAEANEVLITLITGRTHQVRVQMAALGLPLLGDLLYTALANRRRNQSQPPQQQEGQEQGRQQQQEGQEQGHPGRQQQQVRGRALDWCLPALMQPLAPLALQAHSLTVLEDGKMGTAPVCFCAGEPWWRSD